MKNLFGIFLLLFSITSGLNAGDFRLTGTNMGSQNYVKLHWNPSTLPSTANYSYTLYQSDDHGASFQSISANYDKTIKVLNVYPDGSVGGGLKAWMESDPIDGIAGAGKGKILVTAVTITAFNANPNTYLKDGFGKYQYDVVMFGSSDVNGGFDLNQLSRDAMEAFILSGRGVLLGHDTAYGPHVFFNYLADNYLNMICVSVPAVPLRGASMVKAIKDGYLLQYPWAIAHNSELSVPLSHSTGQVAKGVVWMNYPIATAPYPGVITNVNGGTNDFYLTTWNNTAMIQTGHSNGQATDDEKKIIANTLWYLAQFTTETTADARSAMDKATPNLPGGWRSSGSQITVTDTDRGTPYQFYVKATNLINSADIYYSDTINVNVTSHLKGYFILEDSNPAGVPTVIRDADGNITTPLSLAAKDHQQKTYASDRSKYTHIQAVDSVGNLSAVRTLGPPSVFTDTVWFFGQNVTTAQTSPGIIFNNYVPTNASGKTLVNSQGTNFSMGVKTCDGYAFYTTYDGTQGIMYNRKHEPMGVFPAPANSTDGYAGAYIGGNKYAFFVVSAATGDLNYYIVDMNKNGGYGALIPKGTVANNITQGIELFPRSGTSTDYWLVYFNQSPLDTDLAEIKIDLLSGETLTSHSTEISPFGMAVTQVPAMVRSADGTQLAILSNQPGGGGWEDTEYNNYVDIFDIDLATGQLSNKRGSKLNIGIVPPKWKDLYFSLSFSPDGKYIIASCGIHGFYLIGSVDIGDGSVVDYGIDDYSETNLVGGSPGGPRPQKGGGLKMGPDGVVYLKTEIAAFGISWSGASFGFYESIATGDDGENFSIGLTPPAIDPAGINRANRAPVGVDDIVTAYLGESTNIYPTLNDTDADADKLFLSDVSFAVPADVAMGAFTVDKDNKKVVFTPSVTYPFTGNEEIVLNYNIRDSVVINSVCVTDVKIKITVKKRVEAVDDKALVFACGTVEIDVTQNDITVSGTTVSVVLPPSAKKGSASVNVDKVVYNHAGANCETKTGRDTVKYDICYLSICDTANIVITILQNPNITLQDSCSFKPKMVLDLQYDGTYQWQYCATNSTTDTDWANIPYTGVSCTEVKEGWYRVKIVYSGAQTIITPRQLVQYKKMQMPNGIWYQMGLNN